MRILLVRPNSGADSIVAPLGLGYLAAALKRHGHRVELIDALRDSLSTGQVLARAAGWRPDVVGLQMYSSDRKVCRTYLEGWRRSLPQALLLAGGPHPSAVGPAVLDEFPGILDMAFRGEAELSLPRLLEVLSTDTAGAAELESVAGLLWRHDGQLRANPPHFHHDIDMLGTPDWQLLRPESYPHAPYAAFVKRLPVVALVASRGCPNHCGFCSAGFLSGHRIRYRRPEAVVEEIATLAEQHGVREIHFADDNLTADPDFVRELCSVMLRREVRLPWSCPNGVRLETLDDSLLTLMKKSGCYSLAVGIETASERLQKLVGKGLDLDSVRRKLAQVRRAGIRTVGYFILGLPTETATERQATIELSLRLPLDLANFMLFCPLPGTPLYRLALREGRFTDSEDYYFSSLIYVPAGQQPHELRRAQRQAFRRFYTRPRQLALLARNVRSADHLRHIMRRVTRWMWRRQDQVRPN